VQEQEGHLEKEAKCTGCGVEL